MSTMMFANEPLRAIDEQLAKQLCAYEQAQNPGADLALLARFSRALSQALGKGQVCLPLTAEQSARLQFYTVIFLANGKGSETSATSSNPSRVEYQNQPLVLANNKLYLARYYFYEQNVLKQIEQRLEHNQPLTPAQISQLTEILNQLFVEQSTEQAKHPNWQKVAAASACLQSFNVITGGPGTGKTTTVTRLLSALLSLNPALNIALAAPTGKAAARMTESIREAKKKADNLPHKENIPDSSFTLHRLLGWRPQGFKYHANQHLPFDCVVVDEASMIDLPMMSHLLSALAPSAKLILLGDRDQLASVEVGSVLADLCDAGTEHGLTADFAELLGSITGFDLSAYTEAQVSPLQNALAQLRVSYRFDENSGIGQLAKAVNNSQIAAAEQAFKQFDDIEWQLLNDEPLSKDAQWQQHILQGFKDYSETLKKETDIQKIFAAFNQFQVLVAMRQGPYGLEQINQQIMYMLQRQQMLEGVDQPWYHGRPVMISRNDYDLNLFNGDIGIALKQPDGKVRVAFLDAEGGVRLLMPSRLPSHETAFAMTVHKSQGSEFTRVCLLLPNRYQPLITRELIYTAITRAKESFIMFAEPSCWQQGLNARVERASGLRDILWNN